MGALFDSLLRAADASVRKDWDEFAACYHEEVDAWAPTYQVKGRAALVETIQQQNVADGIELDMVLIAETESTVVAEWTWSLPLPQPSGTRTGRACNYGLSYYGFRDGKIAKVRQYFDTASFLRQFE